MSLQKLGKVWFPWAVACLLGASTLVPAATFEYALDLPADQRLGYSIEFEVVHPGLLKVGADWSPPRVLVFRLERPGQRDLRLSGPPPRNWELEVAIDEIDRDAPWTLVISGLPSREASRGRLVIDLPDPSRTEEPEPTSPAPSAPEPDVWKLPVQTPTDLNQAKRRLFEATERFRRDVVEETAPDDYDWQDGMLRFLATRRDRAQPTGVEPSTREMFRRIVEAVELLDRLRQAESEPLSGPAPTGGLSRRAWLAVRDPRFTPAEEELGNLLDALNRGYAPEMEQQRWFTSFLSCLIVCERHFEERARLGAQRAANGDLVQKQWPPILSAVQALDALVALSPPPDQAEN
jgi:hypothetical protein